VLLLLLAVAQPPADFPHQVLTVPGGKLTVYTPDPDKGFYRGTRFANSTVLKHLEVGGHTLFGPWKDKHDPLGNDDITGPAEEFGMFDPLNYADAKPGERFVKIGVGELVKAKDEKYEFWKKYDRAGAGKWETTLGDVKTTAGSGAAVQTTHTLTSDTGYAYRYRKSVALTAPPGGGVALTLSYELTNTGSKPIRTDVYNHNFFNVDGQPVGPRYKLEFPQPVKATAESKFGEAARFDGGTYTFGRPLADKESAFGWLTDAAGKPLPHAYTFRYAGDGGKGVTVRVASEAPVSKFQTWSVRPCMCPEPFTPVDVKPGQTQSWATRYTVTAD
jgi:hypothetical protein